MLNALTDIVLIPAYSMGSESVAEWWRILCPITPNSSYVLDLVFCHRWVKIGDTSVKVYEAVKRHTDCDQKAREGKALHVAGAAPS